MLKRTTRGGHSVWPSAHAVPPALPTLPPPPRTSVSLSTRGRSRRRLVPPPRRAGAFEEPSARADGVSPGAHCRHCGPGSEVIEDVARTRAALPRCSCCGHLASNGWFDPPTLGGCLAPSPPLREVTGEEGARVPPKRDFPSRPRHTPRGWGGVAASAAADHDHNVGPPPTVDGVAAAHPRGARPPLGLGPLRRRPVGGTPGVGRAPRPGGADHRRRRVGAAFPPPPLPR